MSGLSLRTGISAGGSYTPMTPASSTPPSVSGGTIGQRAYGISGTGSDQRAVAGFGSVGVGAFALIALVYFWWSLPR